MDPIWFKLIIIILGGSGFGIAAYIRHTKKRNKTLVCPLHAHCETVVHSEYAQFLGLPVEFLGMVYYGLVVGVTAILLVVPSWNTPSAILGTMVLTLGAVAFSLYLTIIQLFVIHEWCSWCLVSACLCVVIASFSLASLAMPLLPFLAANYAIISLIHSIALGVGVATALITDVLFFKFLADLRIGISERSVLQTLSHILWTAVGAMGITSIGLLLPMYRGMVAAPWFIAIVVISLVIILNGVIMHFVVLPSLSAVFFGTTATRKDRALRPLRRLAFATGAVSSASWVVLFMVWRLPGSSSSLFSLMTRYGIVVVIAIMVSQGVEYVFSRRDF